MLKLQQHSEYITARTAERDYIRKEVTKLSEGCEDSQRVLRRLGRAREIVSEVLMATQETVSAFIEEVVSLALSTVYGNEYSFEFEHGVKRNQSETTPWIVKGGDRFSPREEVGGGVLDVCSLALRLAVWALKRPRSASVFVLDEPGRFLSRDKQGAFGRMLREVSKLLGVQILMVSHSTDIIEHADRAYEIVQMNGISEVREIER